MPERLLDFTDSTETNGGSGGRIGLIVAALAAAAAAVTQPWHPQHPPDDENKRIIERVAETERARPIPGPECDPDEIAADLARRLVRCCAGMHRKWDGQPDHALSQVVTEAIAECVDVPLNPCGVDVERLQSGLSICERGLNL